MIKGPIHRITISLILTAVTLACSDKDDLPEGILSKDDMVSIMLDIYVGEGKVNEMRAGRDSSLALFDHYEKRIYEKFNLTDSTYKRSLVYYYDNPDKFEPIYETILDSLNLWDKQFEEKEKKEREEKEEKEDASKKKDTPTAIKPKGTALLDADNEEEEE